MSDKAADEKAAEEATEAPPKTTLTVTIDGRDIEANPGELLIAAAERTGTYIPRFCWHNRMRSVGMCRMCLVEVDAGRGPALQPACMLSVAEGMKVDTTSPRTRKAQDGVLEFLLINHPLDCPVCDKGGECPLQDQTMSYGPGESRFVEEKRHYEKPIPISDLVFLDRERCILCDRCTRFAKEVAGDPLIHFIDRGSSTQVNTFPDEPFSSYFSGNTVQICPVGALTATAYRFRARPWDLDEVESTCQNCSMGCSVTLQSSRNRLLRTNGVDNDAVNWSWLCDRGRFSFEATNSEARLGEPLLRQGGSLAPVRWADALRAAALAVSVAVADHGPGSVAVLGGARLTNESQYAWAKLAKGIIGTDHVDAQLGDGLPADFLLSLPRATIAQACAPKGTILQLGPDPKETLGVLYLRLRHAIVEDGARLIEVGPGRGGLSDLAAVNLHGLPGDLADLVRGALDRGVLRTDDGPLTVLLGRSSLTEDPAVLCAAASLIHEALPEARFLPTLPRSNVFGAIDAGLAPGLLPGRVTLEDGREAFGAAWGAVPEGRGLDATGILAAAAEGRIEVLVLLGADPVCDFPDRALAERALEQVGTVIAVDQFLTDSSSRADVVLAAAGWAEVEGTTTNIEGRVLRLNQKVTPPGTARADWMIAAELAARLGGDLRLDDTDAIARELASLSAPHRDLLGSGGVGIAVGRDGTVAEGSSIPFEAVLLPPARPLPPSSLRLAVADKLYDGGTLTQQSSSLAHLAPRPSARLHPEDFLALGVAEGAPVTISSAAGQLTLPAAADRHVGRGTVVLTANLPGAEVNRLLVAGSPITDVRVEPAGVTD